MRSTPVTRSGIGWPEARSDPDHRHAVGKDEVAGPAGQRQLRVAAHHAQVGGVGRDDRVGGARSTAKLEAPGHRGLHGHGVEREAQQLGPFGVLSPHDFQEGDDRRLYLPDDTRVGPSK